MAELEDKLAKLREELEAFKEESKEREPSLLRAIRTLMGDAAAYQKGDREELPKAALLGVVFAYLRPRIVVVLAGLLAATGGGLQVWLLITQNRLVRQQNTLLESQTRANRVEAMNSVLTAAETDEELILSQVLELGAEGFETLDRVVRVARRGSFRRKFALKALAELSLEGQLDNRQQGQVVLTLLEEIGIRGEAFANELYSSWSDEEFVGCLKYSHATEEMVLMGDLIRRASTQGSVSWPTAMKARTLAGAIASAEFSLHRLDELGYRCLRDAESQEDYFSMSHYSDGIGEIGDTALRVEHLCGPGPGFLRGLVLTGQPGQRKKYTLDRVVELVAKRCGYPPNAGEVIGGPGDRPARPATEFLGMLPPEVLGDDTSYFPGLAESRNDFAPEGYHRDESVPGGAGGIRAKSIGVTNLDDADRRKSQ